jgi:hypothetical protein
VSGSADSVLNSAILSPEAELLSSQAVKQAMAVKAMAGVHNSLFIAISFFIGQSLND